MGKVHIQKSAPWREKKKEREKQKKGKKCVSSRKGLANLGIGWTRRARADPPDAPACHFPTCHPDDAQKRKDDGRTNGQTEGRTGGRRAGEPGGRADGETGGRGDGGTGLLVKSPPETFRVDR